MKNKKKKIPPGWTEKEIEKWFDFLDSDDAYLELEIPEKEVSKPQNNIFDSQKKPVL